MQQKHFITDYKKVQGLGTAHDGVEHWWLQRVSAVALLFLTPFFLFPFARALGAGHEAMLATYASWWNATIAALFVITALLHLRFGLQVVIEDYVHSRPLRTGLLLANALFTMAAAFAGVFSIAKIYFSA